MSRGLHVVILAAGGSVRLGHPKQLVQVGGESLLRRAVRVATESLGARASGGVIVVTGAHRGAVEADLVGAPGAPHLVDNPEWQRGIGSSLRVGVQAAVDAAGLEALPGILLMLCDQPLLTAAHLSALTAHVESGGLVAASAYSDTLGVPAAFAPALLPELLALADAQGAKALLKRHAAVVHAVRCAEGALDVDTPRDIERLRLAIQSANGPAH